MIQISNISKKYKDFFAVNDVSMKLEAGQVYGLVGKNGAGKSTLFKLILGLAQANQGSVQINRSSNIQELNNEKKSIGFYMGASFYPYLNAQDNLKYVATMKNIKSQEEIDRVLKLVDLYGVKKPFKSFSLGMKQRLGIANALLGDPEIVMLDEPINGLDPQGILEIRKIISDLGRIHNKTVVVSSHILSELELVADRFGIIDHGILLKEFDKEDNQNENQSVQLRTNNNVLAMEVLNHLNPQVLEEKIFLPLVILDNQDIQLLINNDVQIVEIKTQKQNLEQQYFALTGGK